MGKLGKLQAVGEAPVGAPMFHSVKETALMMKVSSMTLYRAIEAGEFPAVKLRGRYLVPAKALEAMVEAAVAGQTVVDAADWVPVVSAVAR
ncbi:MAG: helix-turn-helix domain-containing protein [Pseudonocardia sp.]